MIAARLNICVILISACGISATVFAASPSLPKTAADMEAAHGTAAVAVKDAVLTAAPTDALARDKYVQDVMKEFEKELKSTNEDARLNTAVLFAAFNSLGTNNLLIVMLKNPDAAVRLWAAKGLGSLAPMMKAVGGLSAQRAKASLDDAAKVEKSPAVTDEIRKSLALY